MNLRFIRSLFSTMMVFTIVLSSGVSSLNITAEQVLANGIPFAGGEGIEGDPYQIANCEQLQDIGYEDEGDFLYLDAYFELIEDIECDGEFTPIGLENALAAYADLFDEGGQLINEQDFEDFLTTVFTGSLNGNDYSISGLEIDLEENEGVGLFTMIYEAEISNLDIIAPYVVGYTGVGALAGVAFASEITNVNVLNDTGDAELTTYVRAKFGVYGGGVAGLAGYYFYRY